MQNDKHQFNQAILALGISLAITQFLLHTVIACQSSAAASIANDEQSKALKKIEETNGMVHIPGGIFLMGCDDPSFPDASPIHKVRISSFWLDKTDVTNKDFAKFVQDTGYVTVAERVPDKKDFPDAPPENLVAGSLVFTPPSHKVPLTNHYQWWQYIRGANWQHPEGPDSNIIDRLDHPVVHIAWQDAVAYVKWAGKRLPTEAEFEYAARGGLKQEPFSWGHEFKPKGKYQANIWQGNFPSENTKEDGYLTTAPVASFPANGFGLYDMAGNVWQWCADWYRADYYQTLGNKLVNNPIGPKDSLDPRELGVNKRVQRGGSFLCCDQYCARFMAGARGKGEPDSSSCHVGFRCAKDSTPEKF